jgi:hypothetical protein
MIDQPDVKPGPAPDFLDSAGCAKWLKSLPLVNVVSAHERLLDQLDRLNGFEVAASERQKILELLRAPVSFVQKEHSKKFSSRPAPLAKPEREVYYDVIALWEALSSGYQHCLYAAVGGGPASGVPLVGQRMLWCMGQKMVAYYQAYQAVHERDWRLLHGVYAFAEERGVADKEVPHPEYRDRQTTCTETYVQVLLLNLADPSKLTPRQMEIVSLWLERWAGKVPISPTSSDGEGTAPLGVDLTRAAGASRSTAEGDKVRFLEVKEVGKGLRKRYGLLRKGDTPGSLGLGEDITAPLAQTLLALLYRRWCQDGQSRAHPRRSASGTAQICTGMSAMYYFVTGRAFRMGGAAHAMSQAQHEEIATFGRLATRRDDDPATTPNYIPETWKIRDESASGLRLERIDPAARSRLALGQLLGIRPADAKAFLLCTIRWLSVSEEFELRIGVQILPGVPLGIAIRPTGANAAAEQYTAALMLPAAAALKTPETLVLPAGWFKPQRVIEVRTEGSREVRLASLVDRGVDFERVKFETV